MIKHARSLLAPAITGLVIALLFIVFFPEKLNKDEKGKATRPAEKPRFTTAPAHENPAIAGPVSYAYAVNRAQPGVVNIYTSKIITRKRHALYDDPVFRRFFGTDSLPTRERMQSSLGSGVILSPDGYLLTSNHVIAGADEIRVALHDGRQALGTVVGTDPETDLAVVHIPLSGLPAITLANRESLAVGDVVLAIGNPFGVGQTVTTGIISALGRNQAGLSTLVDFIQTDAAINPGNSGGALINPYGELVGINTAIFSQSGGSNGIGFAIPIDLAKKVMQEIMAHGNVIRGWLGIQPQHLTPDLNQTNINANGLLVTGVVKNGPAHRAGIHPGDTITHLNHQPIKNSMQAINMITRIKPGTQLAINLLRKGKPLKIYANAGARPALESR